jgi:hypothetical protein
MSIAEPASREYVAAEFAAATGSVPPEKVKRLSDWVSGQSNVPRNIANTITAVLWLDMVASFRQAEDALLAEGRYEASLPDHRAFLAELIATGESLVLSVRKSGLAKPPTDFTLEDLQATLETLHITFRCQHGPKNSSQTNAGIAKLFDGQEP